MGKTMRSESGMRKKEQQLWGSVKKKNDGIYLRGKEELTHTASGKPRWDESFFKAATKEKQYRGVKY